MASNGGNMTSEGGNYTEPETPYWPLPVRAILSTTMTVFIAMAIIGNLMVIGVIIKHRGMRTRTNMFLCSLAVADCFTGILLMPFSLTTAIMGKWVFGDTFCQVNGFIMPLFLVTSIHTLMYISIHKYISISRPFSRVLTYRRVLAMILFAWFWGFLTAYLTVHGLNHVEYKAYTTQCGPAYPHSTRTYMLPVYVSVTCYFVPMFIMTFCYIAIFWEMRAHSSRMERNTNQEKAMIMNQQRKISFTLLLVVIVFVLSWSPYVLYSIYVTVIKDKTTAPKLGNPISYWFGYMNSACNPIIYALRSPAFREGYRSIVCAGTDTVASEGAPPFGFDLLWFRPDLYFKTEPLIRSGPFSKLRTLLHRSISQWRGGETPSECERQNSMSSLTNYLLQPKKRAASTCSLPWDLKFRTPALHTSMKVSTPPGLGKGAPNLVLISGIPCLMKNGKIVSCYQDPRTVNRVTLNGTPVAPHQSKSQVYYGKKKEPETPKEEEDMPIVSKRHHRSDEELAKSKNYGFKKSDFLPREGDTNGVAGGTRRGVLQRQTGVSADNLNSNTELQTPVVVESNGEVSPPEGAYTAWPHIIISIDADDAEEMENISNSQTYRQREALKSESDAFKDTPSGDPLLQPAASDSRLHRNSPKRRSFLGQVFDKMTLLSTRQCVSIGSSNTSTTDTLSPGSHTALVRAHSERYHKDRKARIADKSLRETLSLEMTSSPTHGAIRRTSSCKPRLERYPSIEKLDTPKPIKTHRKLERSNANLLSPEDATHRRTNSTKHDKVRCFSQHFDIDIQIEDKSKCRSDPCLNDDLIDDLEQRWLERQRSKKHRRHKSKDVPIDVDILFPIHNVEKSSSMLYVADAARYEAFSEVTYRSRSDIELQRSAWDQYDDLPESCI